MTAEVKKSVPPGTEAGGAVTSAGDVTGDKVVNPRPRTTERRGHGNLNEQPRSRRHLILSCGGYDDKLFAGSPRRLSTTTPEGGQTRHQAHVTQLVNAFGEGYPQDRQRDAGGTGRNRPWRPCFPGTLNPMPFFRRRGLRPPGGPAGRMRGLGSLPGDREAEGFQEESTLMEGVTPEV